MCGRYATSRDPEGLVEDFEIEFLSGPGPGEDPAGARANYNVAPTASAPVVLERRPRREDGAPATGRDQSDQSDQPDQPDQPDRSDRSDRSDREEAPVRWLRLLHWGLVPSWAKDRRVGYRMINARVESLLERTHRRAALTRRCLVPADGWYEWQASPTVRDARGTPRKQPFFLHPLAGGPIAFAGIYAFWRNPTLHPDDPQAWLTSYAIITQDAEPGLRAVHDRMPLVLPPQRWNDWLDPELQDADAVRALLQPPTAGRFAARAVSTRVNSVANNGPELLAPAPSESLHGVLDPATGELIGGGDALF